MSARSRAGARATRPPSRSSSAEEKRQMDAHEGDPAAQQLAACRKMADHRLANNGTMEEFNQKIVAFAQKGLIQYFLPRPRLG